MVKQIFTLIENKVPPSCVAAILFHCTIHYTILLARCLTLLSAVYLHGMLIQLAVAFSVMGTCNKLQFLYHKCHLHKSVKFFKHFPSDY